MGFCSRLLVVGNSCIFGSTACYFFEIFKSDSAAFQEPPYSAHTECHGAPGIPRWTTPALGVDSSAQKIRLLSGHVQPDGVPPPASLLALPAGVGGCRVLGCPCRP